MNSAPPGNSGYTGPLKALVLDWAGTTVDFGSMAPARTMQKLFGARGIALSERETRQHMGLPKKEHIRGILSIPGVRDRWQHIHGRAPGDAETNEMYEDFIPLQFSCLEEYSHVIPGVPEAVHRFRHRGLEIGSTTGYTRAMIDVLLGPSMREGYAPDCSITPEEVGAGRPQPFMIYECAVRLQVSPLAAMVKIGDTPADVQEGLNAGTWSIGVAGTGNMIGLAYGDFLALSDSERERQLAAARTELAQAGAHYVVDTLNDVHSVLDDIEVRLKIGVGTCGLAVTEK